MADLDGPVNDAGSLADELPWRSNLELRGWMDPGISLQRRVEGRQV
jgi:hypothetical protein